MVSRLRTRWPGCAKRSRSFGWRFEARGSSTRVGTSCCRVPAARGRPCVLRTPRTRESRSISRPSDQKGSNLRGELADGWLGTSFMPEHADVFLSHIARGAALRGRTLAELDLQVGGAVEFGSDVERMVRARIRRHREAGVTTLRLAPAGNTLGKQLDVLGHAIELVREECGLQSG